MICPPLPLKAHPQGEAERALAEALLKNALPVDTHGRRYHVEWDPDAPVTPLGQLVFFSQFLATAGLFSDWVKGCPLKLESNNAPRTTDLLGTIVLAVLSGQHRYAHVTALRGDTVNPAGLGMSKVCSEDSVRRAFAGIDEQACAEWQQAALVRTYLPGLRFPWVLDLDVTVKPIYGHQEGAEVGYNPQKPGRPSHTYHTLFVRELRLVLDVEVRPGKEHGATHSRKNLWRFWDSLPRGHRPELICGDASYGQEGLMSECEKRSQKYLFRLRMSSGVKQLVRLLSLQGGWKPTVNGYEGLKGRLQLTGWSCSRRVVILRRPKKTHPVSAPELTQTTPSLALEICSETPEYEYQVLVTNLTLELLSLADLYRQRADAENGFDELKNQWGWGGFTTKDQLRCQVMARHIALVYNWWSLFVRCAEPERPREAITSRPLLLSAVGRVVESGRQTTLKLTSSHAEAAKVQTVLTSLSLFLSGLKNTAEQLGPSACWERIWDRILKPLLKPGGLLGAPSG